MYCPLSARMTPFGFVKSPVLLHKSVIILAGIWLTISLPVRAQPSLPPDPAIAVAWADVTVKTMTRAPQNTPTYGSRALGYLGLTMYETVVCSSKKYRSVARQLCDTLVLPQPDHTRTYCYELALNAGQAYMMHALYGYTNSLERVDSLARAMHDYYANCYPPDVVTRSEAYGRALAHKIYQWSQTDGGHKGYERNFPADYVLAKGLSIWQVPIIGQTRTKVPMHPDWGKNRVFVARNHALPLPKPLPYSTDSSSQYHQQYKEVFTRNKTLTEADCETALWWGDDPNLTCSPPGHSYYLATKAVRKANPDLVKAAQTYCRVGMAVADAFVVCWKTKFTYMVERPSTFVATMKFNGTHYMDRWYPFFPEPPFPAFYSGHATQSAAMATVLTDLYGDNFSFVDDTHVARAPVVGYGLKGEWKPLVFTPRAYSSFWAAARECAESRLLGGIHTRHDNEVGLAEGAKIGQAVNRLQWK
ncbi:MAG: phosphatase PAP2 family protein [Cytophagales bacterium]|nr:MAG: phosphatase PAP2 family protein [Cytophagales bacterium]